MENSGICHPGEESKDSGDISIKAKTSEQCSHPLSARETIDRSASLPPYDLCHECGTHLAAGSAERKLMTVGAVFD